MKSLYALSTAAFLLSAPLINAQTFLNGSFETTTGGCDYNLANATFSGSMSNSVAFGSADQMDILNNTCGYGAAENGTHFVGLAVDNTNTLTDAFSLELSAPLIAGNTYVLTFYNRKDVGYNANQLEVGYSSSNSSFGTAIDTTAVPNTSWAWEYMTFTPAINCSYITVRTIAGSYGWNFVDDFVIADITGTSNLTREDQTLQVYPNPTSGLISFVTSSSTVVESVTVKDVQGSTILVSQSAVIDLSGLAAGIYFLEVATNNGTSIKRIVKE